jgi:L-cystine uptake protein TcyP (sodium:dicarboxylate symporter family)
MFWHSQVIVRNEKDDSHTRLLFYALQIGNIAGFLLIVFSATVTNAGDAGTQIWSRHWSFYVACAAPCVLGLIIASVLASLLNLQKPERM